MHELVIIETEIAVLSSPLPVTTPTELFPSQTVSLAGTGGDVLKDIRDSSNILIQLRGFTSNDAPLSKQSTQTSHMHGPRPSCLIIVMYNASKLFRVQRVVRVVHRKQKHRAFQYTTADSANLQVITGPQNYHC